MSATCKACGADAVATAKPVAVIHRAWATEANVQSLKDAGYAVVQADYHSAPVVIVTATPPAGGRDGE